MSTLPEHFAITQRYMPNQRADYDENTTYKTTNQGYELCNYVGCAYYAINFSGWCHKHGGADGPSGMTRWDKLVMGFIGVEQLDDEELTKGCTARTKAGKVIPRKDVKIPHELYRKMVAELYKRHDERMRGMLDECIDTMFGIMTNDAYEPSDRMRAATWIFERIRGKTAETIKVEVDTAPWQAVLEGIARLPRAESRALRGGGINEAPAIRESTIDAEVVEDVPISNDTNGIEHDEHSISDGVGERRDAEPTDTGADTGSTAPDAQMGAQGEETYDVDLAARIPGTREYEERMAEAEARAQRIKERKETVQRARNRRYAARAQGHLESQDAQPVTKGKRVVQPEDVKAPPPDKRSERWGW